MKTKTVAALLLSTISGAAILYGVWRLSDSTEETPQSAQPVASPADPLDADVGSPKIATSKEVQPRPTADHGAISATLAEMEHRLSDSAAASDDDQTVGLNNNDRSIHRPDKLEKEDNVRVGIVFSVSEDGLEVEGKGVKKIFRKIFNDEDEEGKD